MGMFCDWCEKHKKNGDGSLWHIKQVHPGTGEPIDVCHDCKIHVDGLVPLVDDVYRLHQASLQKEIENLIKAYKQTNRL